jgi:hypothetical protein
LPEERRAKAGITSLGACRPWACDAFLGECRVEVLAEKFCCICVVVVICWKLRPLMHFKPQIACRLMLAH